MQLCQKHLASDLLKRQAHLAIVLVELLKMKGDLVRLLHVDVISQQHLEIFCLHGQHIFYRRLRGLESVRGSVRLDST